MLTYLYAYTCIFTYSTWIRFGQDAFTLPLGTEHQARCHYSSTRKDCPVPPDCVTARAYKNRNDYRIESICGEMPLLN